MPASSRSPAALPFVALALGADGCALCVGLYAVWSRRGSGGFPFSSQPLGVAEGHGGVVSPDVDAV